MVFQFAQPVHVIFLLVQLKRVKAMLSLLLVIDLSRCLFLTDFLLGILELVIDRFEHVSLFLGGFPLFLLGVYQEQVFRYVQQLS